MICVDDLTGWPSPLGNSTVAKTPSLDRLATSGTTFSKAYCSAPACGPSRAAILTGMPPTTTGCYVNVDLWTKVIPEAITLPRLFRDSGYWTAGFGKIFHQDIRNDDPKAWDERAYDVRLPIPSNAPLNGISELWETKGSFDWGPIEIPVEEMDDHKQVSRAIESINKERDKPFFIACGIYRPHLPWYVPREFFDLYPMDSIEVPTVLEDDLDDVPAMGRAFSVSSEHQIILESGQWKNAVQAYLASLSYADFEIGRLIEGLNISGKKDNTLVVLWSDHGWHFGPKNHWRKFTLWEEATKSVLIFAGPGIAENRNCDKPVSLLDIYPSLLGYTGVDKPTELISGRNLLPLLANPDLDWKHPVVSTFTYGNHSVRSESYRYIRYSDGGEELYDHNSDPNEWVNLVPQGGNQEIIDSLAAFLPQTEAPAGASYPHFETAWRETSRQQRFLNPFSAHERFD